MLKNFHYTIYGLHIITDQPVSGVIPAPLEESSSKPVFIHFVGDIASLPFAKPSDQFIWYTHPYKDENGVPALQVWRKESIYYLVYLDGSYFIVKESGDEVWAAWTPKSHFESIVAQISGSILGLILQLRGFLVLHASVIAWEGQAFAILGTSGVGKSTIAAHLYQQGCQVLSDDIAALFRHRNAWWVHPGYPRIRLWSQTAEALYGAGHNLHPIDPENEEWDKRYLDLTAATTASRPNPFPFRSIFALNWGIEGNTQVRIAQLEGGEALANLDANSYMGYLLDRQQHRRQMTDLASLLDQVSVFQVQPVPDLERLSNLGRVILASIMNS